MAFATSGELPPYWLVTWAKLSNALIRELPEDAINALKTAFSQGGSSSASSLFATLNGRGFFRQADNVKDLIEVLCHWSNLTSVREVQAAFELVRSIPPPTTVANNDSGGQKRKLEEFQVAQATSSRTSGKLVWQAPIRLLTIRGSHFEVDPTAKDVLNQLPKTVELVVVCAVGKFRGGKSFLLNRLLGQRIGFEVLSSSSGVTRGVWMWARWLSPARIMLVLDTQGLFDPESEPASSRNIFSLATLLSSVMLFNVESDIDESSLQQLSFIGDFADNICLWRGMTGKQHQTALARHFPSLVVVVRNWQRDLAADMTENDYLEKSLQQMSRASPTGRDICSRLQTLFPERRFVAILLSSFSCSPPQVAFAFAGPPRMINETSSSMIFQWIHQNFSPTLFVVVMTLLRSWNAAS